LGREPNEKFAPTMRHSTFNPYPLLIPQRLQRSRARPSSRQPKLWRSCASQRAPPGVLSTPRATDMSGSAHDRSVAFMDFLLSQDRSDVDVSQDHLQ